MKLRELIKDKSNGNSVLGKLFCIADRHYEIVIYIFFGGLTTLVDWMVRFFLYKTSLNIHITDIIAWMLAVLFAFMTNRKFVFESQRSGIVPIAAELGGFALGRVFSLVVQEILMYIANSILHWNPTIVMIPVSVLVVVINYIFGKMIFKKKS